jgi:hypothetical protein
MKLPLRLALLATALGLGAALVWLLMASSRTGVPSFSSPQVDSHAAPSPAVAQTAASSAPSFKPKASQDDPSDAPQEDISPLAPELNSDRFPAQHDVDVLHTLLRQYLRRLGRREALPVGNDSDLAKVLGGENPMKYATLPANHPAFSPDGRLRDRWGTPYFVHPVAPGSFEIRSAGPDRKLFTSDDLIADPNGGSAQ